MNSTKRSIVFWFTLMISLSLPFVLVSCESDGGDDPGAPASEITGDAQMTVDNNSDDLTTVYFDGAYIGSVEGNSQRTWDVPSGTHNLVFDNAEQDNSDEVNQNFTFPAGQNYEINIDWIED